MKLFALNATRPFGEKVAAALGTTLAEHEEREFEDGEHKARPLVSVRGRDVYVIHSLHEEPEQSVNDKICRLLFFLGAIREGGARRLTAVIPYLAYARKDRQTKSRDPVTTRYMAQLFEAVGIDAVMTLDVHNLVAFQNAFRCQSHHLDTRRVFTEHLLGYVENGPVVVASPDPGGVKRAQLFAETFEKMVRRSVGAAFMEKRRSAGVVSGTRLVGDVAGATVLVIDDLISTGGTMLRAADACLSAGAKVVYAIAAHGLFVGNASEVVADRRLAKVIVSDTVPPVRLDRAVVEKCLDVVSAAPLFAEAIRRTHQDQSLVELLEGEPPE